MSTVAVYSYTHSVVYVADNILKSFKDVVRLSDLDPQKLVGDWAVLQRGIAHWLETQHLRTVTLEIYDPRTNLLVTRWDVDVTYAWSSNPGSFWTDTDQLRYAIKKAGLAPAQASYRVLVDNKAGWPSVEGWTTTSCRSTDGFVRQSLGATIEHNGLGANASYWRKS